MNIYIYIACMAGITFLIRVLPLTLIRGEIKNRTLRSFLYYVPYSVLAVMTVPAIFYSTSHVLSAIVGTAIAAILAYNKKSLLAVAASASLAVMLCELLYLI